FPLDHALNGEGRSATDRMRIVGLAVLQCPGAMRDGIINLARADRCADRLIATAETLAEGDDIRDHAVLLARQECPRPAGSAHHFIEDQQDSVAITDVTD